MPHNNQSLDKHISQTELGVTILFGILFAVQTGVMSLQILSLDIGIGITLYNILAPVLFVFVIVGLVIMKPTIQLDWPSFVYLLLNTLLVGGLFSIEMVANGRIAVFRVLGHLLALCTASAFAILIRRIEPQRLFKFMIIGVTPVIVMDLGAMVGVVDLHNASPILPMFHRGGIGITTSFGAHGIVVLMGLFALIGIIPSTERSSMQNAGVGLLGVMFYVILFSQSRSTIAGLIFGMVVIIGFFARRNLTPLDSVVRWSFPVGAAIIWVVSAGLIEIRAMTFSSRTRQIEIAIELLQQHPFGIGWDQFLNYSTHVLHNTPLNYFVAGGYLLGTLFLLIVGYPLFITVKSIALAKTPDWPLHVLTAIYVGVTIELLLFKSVPSVHLMIVGLMICWRAHSRKNTETTL